MRSIEWLCCRWLGWPLSTLNHFNFYILHCLMHLRNWRSQILQIWCTGWMWKSSSSSSSSSSYLIWKQIYVKNINTTQASQPTDDKLSLIGAWSDHVTHYKILGLHITGTAEPKVVKFCTRVGNINSMQQDDIYQQKGVVMVTWLF